MVWYPRSLKWVHQSLSRQTMKQDKTRAVLECKVLKSCKNEKMKKWKNKKKEAWCLWDSHCRGKSILIRASLHKSPSPTSIFLTVKRLHRWRCGTVTWVSSSVICPSSSWQMHDGCVQNGNYSESRWDYPTSVTIPSTCAIRAKRGLPGAKKHRKKGTKSETGKGTAKSHREGRANTGCKKRGGKTRRLGQNGHRKQNSQKRPKHAEVIDELRPPRTDIHRTATQEANFDALRKNETERLPGNTGSHSAL